MYVNGGICRLVAPLGAKKGDLIMNRFAEYGLPSKHPRALLMTKAKNAIRRCAETRGVNVSFVGWHNDNINGQKVGCSGFVVNNATNKVVYVNAPDARGGSSMSYMFREARDTRDYGGAHSRNQWSGEKTAESLAEGVVAELMRPKRL